MCLGGVSTRIAIDRCVGASVRSVTFELALGSNAGSRFSKGAISESRSQGDQDSTRVEGRHDDAGDARQLVRALVSQWHDNMKRARRITAEEAMRQEIRTESLVRVYCSMETISSPVSSFLCLGAMVAGLLAVYCVLVGGQRVDGGVEAGKRQRSAFAWGAGVGGPYVTAPEIWRACPAFGRSDARPWALPLAGALNLFR